MGNQTLKIFKFAAPVIVLVTIVFFLPILSPRDSVIKKMQVGGNELSVEIADTDALKQRGLSGRDKLGENSGMLFVYSNREVRYFWMKDMKFPLDVLWIAGDKVVGLQENIPFQSSDGEVVRFQSNAPTDMVLEVNAGWVARNGVKIRDVVVQN